MTTETATDLYTSLLLSVILDPEDDASRHALADYLEDGGYDLAWKAHLPGRWERGHIQYGDRTQGLYWVPNVDPDGTTGAAFVGLAPEIRCELNGLSEGPRWCDGAARLRKFGVWGCLHCLSRLSRQRAQEDRDQ